MELCAADGFPMHSIRANAYVYGMALMGPCVIVYNLDESRMNCDRLFALFGLYGDVVKVCCKCRRLHKCTGSWASLLGFCTSFSYSVFEYFFNLADALPPEYSSPG
jgi:hypothetical protein